MTYTETIKQGAAAVRRTAAKNIMEVLVSIRESDPTAGNEVLFRKWFKQIKDDDELLEATARHTFTNLNQALEPKQKTTAQRRTKEEIQASVESYKRVIRKILVLDMVAPNGKTYRENTFGYLLNLGGAYTRIGKAGKPNEIVGKVLSDEKAQKLWYGK